MTPISPRTVTIFTCAPHAVYWSHKTTAEVKGTEKLEDVVKRACEKAGLSGNQIVLTQNEDTGRPGAILAFRLNVTLSVERLETIS